MYLLEFIVNLFRKSNIGLIIYMILNVGLLYLMIGKENQNDLLIVLALYLLSLTIALSPIGEYLLRIQTGSERIKDEELKQRIQAIFERVYARVLEVDPRLNKKIRIFINEEKLPSAFAVGRKTICITEGLIALPDDEIEAILAHEFAHLVHKDTDILLVITFGNLIVTGLLFIVKWFFSLFRFSRKKGLGFFLSGELVMELFMWLWTALGLVLTMHSARRNELEADHFAYELGYGNKLASALERICESDGDNEPESKFLRAIYSSHPKTEDRVEKLRGLAVEC